MGRLRARMLGTGVAAVVLVMTVPAMGGWMQWTEGTDANGHFYQVVSAPEGISWMDARVAAVSLGGDLATITSLSENEFVFDLVNDQSYWVLSGGGTQYGPWLGGYQTPHFPVGTQDPAADWHWVTGEPWDYENWNPGEPDDSSGFEEDRLHYGSGTTQLRSTWTDDIDAPFINRPIAFVMESSVPEPSTIALLGLGSVGLLLVRRRRSASRD